MARDRLAAWVIAFSLFSLPFILPHVVEDFAEEIAHRVGLSTAAGAFALGMYLALQSFGLVLVALGRRIGFLLTFWLGLIWVAGAVVDHTPAIWREGFGFRSGFFSLLWVVGLVCTQGLAAGLAAWGAWGRRGQGISRFKD